MKKLIIYGAQIVGAIIGYSIARIYPGIFFQWLFALLFYWLGSKLFTSKFKPIESKNNYRKKIATILSVVGLLGLISPIVGFIFALPAYLLSKYALTQDYSNRKKILTISGIVLLLCILNANLGNVISASR